ncbi:MAG: lipid A export permease/ATP-binding protein MsbA [Nitrococcus sp.]|nr:lipid A export permease/ATP-binding protein MsbA [Nitrococcus sp.]
MNILSSWNNSADRRNIYRRLFGYSREYWLIGLLSLIAMVITGASQTVFAWLIKPMLDAGFVARDPTMMRLIPLGLLALFVLRGLTNFAASYGTAWISRNVIKRLRAEVFDRLLTLPKRYYDDASSGMLLSKLTYNAEQVASAGADALITVVRDTATAVFLMAYMFYVSWHLALSLLALGPVMALVVLYVSKRFRRISHRIQRSVGSVAYVAEEVIDGHEVIKIFGAQDYERRRFEPANERNRRQFMKFVAIKAVSTPVVQLVAAVALTVVIYLATLGGGVTNITVGAFVSFITAMLLLQPPLKRLTQVHALIQKGLAAGESLFEVIDEEPETDGGRLELGRACGRIEYQGVRFAYRSGAREVLRGIDIRIEPGETVAIVGPSGSGKTTLANLLPRFYEPSAGRILLDGVALADYRLAALRSQFALVSQQVTLFNDTIAGNIAYGRLADVGMDEVRRVTELANARTFIEGLSQGFETRVGENGVLLSGGQRQRIAIARALLKDAPVLILDEATSALDTQSERLIQHALDTLMRGRTTLVISHRLSTVENADRIIVLDEGCVVEVGTQSELLARSGLYASLYRRHRPPPPSQLGIRAG